MIIDSSTFDHIENYHQKQKSFASKSAAIQEPNKKARSLDNINHQKPKLSIFFISPHGSTRKISEHFKSACQSWAEVELFDLGKNQYTCDEIRHFVQRSQIILVGSPIYQLHGLFPIYNLLRSLKIEKNHKKLGFGFVTYGHVSSGVGLRDFTRLMQKLGIRIVGGAKFLAPHFYESLVGYPSSSQLDLIKNAAKRLQEYALGLLECPSPSHIMCELDYQPLKVKIVAKIAKKIARKDIMAIHFDPQKCKHCQLCVRSCPLSSRSLLRIGDKYIMKVGKCIHCYNCVEKCPTNALSADIEGIRQLTIQHRKILKKERNNALIMLN